MAGSATMKLLNGNKNKGKEDPVDEELKTDEPAEEQEVEEEDDSPLPASEEDTPGVPTSKTEVHALTAKTIGPVHEAMGSPIKDFTKLSSMKKKKQALLDHLFPEKEEGEEDVEVQTLDPDSPLGKIATAIENVKTRPAAEKRIRELSKQEAMGFFEKGGLLIRIQELGDYGEHSDFATYVKAEGYAPDYRTARYWMKIYTDLLELGIPYDELEEIGWTKTLVLLPVLTLDNYKKWKEKALAVNVPTLKSEVEAALNSSQDDGSGNSGPTDGGSEFKTMSFKLVNDQIETVQDALAKAMKQSGTETKEVALEYVCLEFTANSSNKKKDVKVETIKSYDPETLDPSAFFEALHTKFEGEPWEAMAFLFGPESGKGAKKDPETGENMAAFERLFPEVSLELNPAETGGEEGESD